MGDSQTRRAQQLVAQLRRNTDRNTIHRLIETLPPSHFCPANSSAAVNGLFAIAGSRCTVASEPVLR